MSSREDYQKYRVIDGDGSPTSDEKYRTVIMLAESLGNCSGSYIVRRTRGLDAEVEMLHLGIHRGVRFSTTDSVRVNVLRLWLFEAQAGAYVVIATSGPDGWKALREIDYVLSKQGEVREANARGENPRSLKELAYHGFMRYGCDEDAEVEREVEAALGLIAGIKLKRITELTGVACTKCSEKNPFLHVVLVPYDARSVWAGDALCDSCCKDVGIDAALSEHWMDKRMLTGIG